MAESQSHLHQILHWSKTDYTQAFLVNWKNAGGLSGREQEEVVIKLNKPLKLLYESETRWDGLSVLVLEADHCPLSLHDVSYL